MDVGIAGWILDARPSQSIAIALRHGFQHVQLDLGDDPLRGVDDVFSFVQASNRQIYINALGAKVLNDLGLTSSPASRSGSACQSVIERTIQAAISLKCGLVFFPSFRRSKIYDLIGLKRTARLLKRACEIVGKTGIVVATENDLGVHANSALLDAVSEANFRILLDTFNPVLGGNDPVVLVKTLAPWIATQIHLKDGIQGQMGNVGLGLGEGRVERTLLTLNELSSVDVVILETNYMRLGLSWIRQDLDWLAGTGVIPHCRRPAYSETRTKLSQWNEN